MKLLPLVASALISLPLLNLTRPGEDHVAEIKAILVDFHVAAAEPDAERYLGYLAPDCVFYGTASEERWQYEEYRKLVAPLLEQGVRIQNRSVEQNVFVSEDGKFAWFDETLDKRKYGEMRATGVLRRTEEGWKFVQYHLTFPIPNEIVPEVVKLRRAAESKR